MEHKVDIILEQLKEKQYDISIIRERLKNEINLLEKKILFEENKIWTKGFNESVELWKHDLSILREKELRELIRDANVSLMILKLQYQVDEKNGFNGSELESEKYNETRNGIISITRESIKFSAETGIIDKSKLDRYNNYLIIEPEIKLDVKDTDNNAEQPVLRKFGYNGLKVKLKVFIKDEKLQTGRTVSARKINKFVRQMENEGYLTTYDIVRAKLSEMGYSKEK